MNFYSKEFLREHAQSILDFYNTRVVDTSGGFYQNYLDDGELFDPKFKQLVSSTRIVVNYATASQVFQDDEQVRHRYHKMALHGLNYVEEVHWQHEVQQYAWTLNHHNPEDMTQQAYGYAFVLLMYASCRKNGIIHSDEKLEQTYALLEKHFWQQEYGLYADEISAAGVMSTYRGQNANMHLCEAMIAAYEATQNQMFLSRAVTIAKNITQRQAAMTDGLIWEHYTPTFKPDWDYNKDDPKNLYRPWGFQPGHQTEWTKLLLMINRLQPQEWLVNTAKMLFDRAFESAWDIKHGGLIYGFDPDNKWCDDDKYFWVQAESFAAAAMLFNATSDEDYLLKYQQIWQYCWNHFVDHTHGAWFRVLNRDNSAISNEKSAAGAKCDYHNLGACFEVLKELE